MSSTATATSSLPFYPAYTFSASPTWFTWAKLTSHSIHHSLRPRADFPSHLIDAPPTHGPAKPLLLFYLNHPIQFVQVIGIVVAIDDVHGHFILLTVDDSSGSTIDVIFWKAKANPTTTAATTGKGGQNDTGQAPPQNNDDNKPIDSTAILTLLSTLHIGHCIQAKGTLTQFRGIRQINLLRLTVIPTTTCELHLINARTTYLSTILNQPWQLSPSRLNRLREKAEGDRVGDIERAERAKRRAQQKLNRETRHSKEIMKRWDEEEKEREKAAEVAKRAGEEVMRNINMKRHGEIVGPVDD